MVMYFWQEEMDKIVKDYDMKSPSTGNDLTDALEFNLMFPISIGPTGELSHQGTNLEFIT